MKSRILRSVGIILGMLLLATPTLAQTPVSTGGAITVTAFGSATAPADSAMIVITIGTDGSMMPLVEGIEDSSGTATTGTSTVDPAPIVAALVALGVPEDSIEIVEPAFFGEWSQYDQVQSVSIIVTISAPTVEFIGSMLDTTRSAAHENGWLVNTFGVLYQVNDCRPLYQAARTDAVTNAQASAEDQAAAMGTTVGAPVSSRDNSTYGIGMPNANCASQPEVSGTSKIYMAGGFDPSLPTEVTITVWVDITFATP